MARPTLTTPLCDLLGIEYPILSAGMGPSLIGETTGAPAELVIAVSEAGGLGVLGGAGYTVEALRDEIRRIKARTDKPFGVDVLLPADIVARGDAPFDGPREVPIMDVLGLLPDDHRDWVLRVKDELDLPDPEASMPSGTTTERPHAAVQVCIEEGVPFFCAGLGNPGFMVDAAHDAGMLVLGIAGNARTRGRIAASGADLVVAQGHEAGGHTGRIGSVALWPQAMDAARRPHRSSPPAASATAGGLPRPWRWAAPVSGSALDSWLQRKVGPSRPRSRPSSRQPTRTRAARSSTPGRPRGPRTTASTTCGTTRASNPSAFPLQVVLSSAMVAMLDQAGRSDYVGPFAGQVSGLIHEIEPAARIVERLVEETVEILGRRLPGTVTIAPG